MRFLSWIILFFLFGVSHAQESRILHFNQNVNLSESYVYSIVQDSSGYLWVSTSNGVFRHNGFDFEYFSHDELVNDNFITSSFNHNNKVWLGHRTGGITSVEGTTFKAYSLADTLLSSIVEFTTDKNNTLWAASYSDGLFNLSDPKLPVQYTFSEEYFTVQSFCFIDEKNLLVGTDDGLYLCYVHTDNKIQVKKRVFDIPGVKIPSILSLSNEDYIIATENSGVFWLILSDRAEKVSNLVTSSTLKDNYVTNLLLDTQWNLWIGTMGGGLLKLSDVFNKTNTNSDPEWFSDPSLNHINYLFEDRDENIWIGGYGSGLSRISRNPFTWDVFDEIEDKDVVALAAGGGYKWVATKSQLFCLNTNNQLINSIYTNDLFPDTEISDLYISDSSSLWIATNGKGLFRFNCNTQKVSPFFLSDGNLENTITDLEGSEEIVWIGTRKGLAKLNLSTNKLRWFTIQSGSLPHNVINDIYIDSDKNVWVITPSGVNFYNQNGSFIKLDIPTKESIIIVNAIVKDQSGNIWLATNGNGVFKIRNDSILNLHEDNGLYSNYCYSLITDKLGYVWVVHKGGISRIHSEVLAVRSIRDYAALTDEDEFNKNACLMDEAGQLWFGANRGILNYNPNWENLRMLPPIINIVNIKINGVDYKINGKIKLKPGTYRVEFEYIGINLKEPEKVRYQYRLKGYDNEWSEITPEQSAAFSGIGSGKYVFELNASSGDGVSSASPFNFSIIVRKPFWMYWWAYPIFLVVFIILFLAFAKRREYMLLKDNLRLEEGVKERTIEIERQKDEIERQGDLIRKKNLDIMDSIKYARTIQSAIFPPEEILSSAIPDYFLINKPKDIVSGDFCWYTKSNGKFVIAITDCTGHGVPGSIMSMLGITLFNEVVNNLGVTNSAEILEQMRDKVISALNQHKKENPSYDGMNVGLCVLDPKKKSLQFSGAFHNLIHFRNGELDVVKAERTPIGYTPLDMPPFKEHNIKYQKGDMFYMFSDGFQDQFGGEDDKKYTNKRLIALLNEVSNRPIDEQNNIIESELMVWMQDNEQTDDIILLGFRL